jgi:hypothetical protein
VRVVDVGGDDRRNLTVVRVGNATGRDAFVQRALRLDVRVANHGPRDVTGAQLLVFVDGGETPARRVGLDTLPGIDAVTGDAREGEPVLVEVPAASLREAGGHHVRVLVEPPRDDPEADALGLDSQRWLALRVRDRIRVLAWARTGQGAMYDADTYLRAIYGGLVPGEGTAGAPPPIYAFESVSSEAELSARLARTEEPVDLVVLANVAPRASGVDALVRWVAAGGGLLAFVGDEIDDPDALNAPFHANPGARLLPFPFQPPETRPIREEPFRFALDARAEHPLARPFTDESSPDWMRAYPPEVFGRLPLRDVGGEGEAPARERTTDVGGRVVLRFQDGPPAIVEGGLGRGRTLWVATSVDDSWSRALPYFLPVLLEEAAVWLTRPDELDLDLEVGERIAAVLPRDARGERILAPGGEERVPTRHGGLAEGDAPAITQGDVGVAGIWRLTYGFDGAEADRRVEQPFAVNPDPTEGALTAASEQVLRGRLPPEADVRVLTSWAEEQGGPVEVREGEAAGPLLWLVLAVLAAESLLAWLFGRKRSMVDADEAVE